jgi:hypothetical protein
MWECKKCHESVEDTFDACWNCGTSVDGVEDPSFQQAEGAEVDPTAAAADFQQAGEVVARIPPAELPASGQYAPAPAGAGPSREQPPPHSAPDHFYGGSDHPVAEALVSVFRFLAVVCALLFLSLVFMTTSAVKNSDAAAVAVLMLILQGVLSVSLCLAVSEGLRLAIVIERNTRPTTVSEGRTRDRRPE